MSRPPKPISALVETSHVTKAQIELREQGEKALLSGVAMFERPSVKADPAAHKEFIRLQKLMKAIGKNDALYASAYNRYCELFAECEYYRKEIERLRSLAEKLEQKFDESDDATTEEITDFAKQLTSLLKQINSMDSAVMSKRKMMFDIEKENVMTVASALRSIPKNPETSPADDALLKALQG